MHTACVPPLAPSVSRVCPAAVAAALAGHHLRDATIYFNPRTPYGVRQKSIQQRHPFFKQKGPRRSGGLPMVYYNACYFLLLGQNLCFGSYHITWNFSFSRTPMIRNLFSKAREKMRSCSSSRLSAFTRFIASELSLSGLRT